MCTPGKGLARLGPVIHKPQDIHLVARIVVVRSVPTHPSGHTADRDGKSPVPHHLDFPTHPAYTVPMPQPLLFRIIDKAVYDYTMIEGGDRLLVGASGGKDSTALIHYLAFRRRRPGADFSFTALHVQSEITPPLSPELEALYADWGVAPIALDVNVLGRLKPGRKMNCYWCSTQRRTELLDYAIKNGYNKLVLGHHLDDMLETLLMNMINKGELSTMAPKMTYRDYPLAVIRPLCYADEGTIIAHGKEQGYMSGTCTCGYQDNSGRKEARRKLEQLTDGDVQKKKRLLSALKNIYPEYLP